jgi:ribonuclease P/MRP protein subunit POP5
MKEKKRFLVFQIIAKNKFNFDSVQSSLQKECLDFLGTDSYSDSGITFIKERWNSTKQRGMIKVNPKSVDKLKTSLALVKTIDNKQVIVNTVGVSGIIKKAEDKFMAS